MQKVVLICLFLIITIGAFLRFYKVLEYPVQLNHDEITQLYDAISIAETKKDIYGNFMPSIFISIHDFKPPFYTYITSLVYLLIGGGELTIKIPGLIFGILLIPAVFLFSYKLFKNRYISLSAAFLTAIAPFELFFSRKSFENGAGIFLMTLAFSFFIHFIENQKRKKWFYISVTFLAIAMYTYFSHAVIIPALLFTTLVIYRKKLINFDKKGIKKFSNILLPLLIWAILITPLLLLILKNPDARYRTNTVFITQDINLGSQLSNYENLNPLTPFLRLGIITEYSFNRYLSQFDPSYIFGEGLDFTNQGPINMGLLFFFQLPLVVFGFIKIIRNENLEEKKKFITAWILLGLIPSGLTFENYSPHRSIMVFTMLNIISAVGLVTFFNWVTNLKRDKLYKLSSTLILGIFIVMNTVYFLHMYTSNFPNEKSQYIQYPFKQVALFAWSEYNNYDQIIFDPYFGQVAPFIGTAAHYYIAYYGNYPPEKFQKEYKLGDKPREVIFDKFSIRKLDWRQDHVLKKTLVIASPWSLPLNSIKEDQIIKIFYHYDKQPAFYAIKLD